MVRLFCRGAASRLEAPPVCAAPEQAVAASLPVRRAALPRHRGQSIAEFALIFPIIVILIVLVADLGRVFSAGVILESATRNGAETAALEYERNPPGDPTSPAIDRLTAPAPTPGSDAYYDNIHAKAAREVCADMRNLPNTTFDDVLGTCPSWPVIRVCVRDGVDTRCGDAIPGFNSTVPAECADLLATWAPDQKGHNRDVEVRACYPFTPLVQVPAAHFDQFELQRTRVFAVPCYVDPTVAHC
jgi:TadE-like protein